MGRGLHGARGRTATGLRRGKRLPRTAAAQRGPGAKAPTLPFFFEAKLSFYLDKLFKKCK